MDRRNCWEVMKCGREINGKNIEKYGICPTVLHNDFDGVNDGNYGGRFCWTIAGTLCKGKPAGTFAQKLLDCLECKFFKQVNEEEGRQFILTPKSAKK